MIYKVEETQDGKLLVNESVIFDILDDGKVECTFDEKALTVNEANELADEFVDLVEKSLF